MLWTPCLRAFLREWSTILHIGDGAVVMFEFGMTRARIQVRMFLPTGETLYGAFFTLEY